MDNASRIFTGILIALTIVAAIGCYFVGTSLGYEIDWVRLVLLVIFIDGLLIPGFLLVKVAESGKDKWGGAAETGGVLMFGAATLLVGLALAPLEAQRKLHEVLGPFRLTPPSAPQVFLTPVTEVKPEQFEGAKFPGVSLEENEELYVQIILDRDKLPQGVIVPKERKGLQVWYKKKNSVPSLPANR